MSKSWMGLKFPSLPFPLFPKDRLQSWTSVKWSPPQDSYIKLNFDGSSKGNLGKSGISFSLHDYLGTIINFEAFPIAPGTNNLVEAYAMLQGISATKRLCVHHIHVEGDSSIIINACIQRTSFSRHIHYVLSHIWSLLDSFYDVLLTHTFCEGNS